MSNSLAVEESPSEQFLHDVEDALFGTIFEIQKTRKEDYVRINYLTGLASIFLDFVQILPYLVHGMKLNSIISLKSHTNAMPQMVSYNHT